MPKQKKWGRRGGQDKCLQQGSTTPAPPAGRSVLASQTPPEAGQLWVPLTWLFQGAISESSRYSLSRQ